MSIRLIGGDCREVLATLPADSVHCVVTSPPYYGLRDYGTAQWTGGDAACEHSGRYVNQGDATGRVCSCGATRVDRQIGLEPTPDAYLAEMVRVFREVRRVLRPDGTCFVNMGDSFSSGNSGQRVRDTNGGFQDGLDTRTQGATAANPGRAATIGLAPKQLLMMPARLALALQADGWWLRSDIIWHKPNPMPESVTDRPTSAHEHVFLLAKAARYFYDADAVREEAEYGRSVETASWHAKADANSAGVRFKNTTTPGTGGSRNLRNVWTIATAPYSEAHFATFPPALAERCIRAGTSERGCCAACGAPWGRQTQGVFVPTQDPANVKAGDKGLAAPGWNVPRGRNEATTTGWAASCACNADVVPCRVLDPFAGAGTTLLVADRLQRHAIGIELSPDYTRMAMNRCRDDAPLFAEPSPPPAEPPEEPRIRDLFA